ncbi:MAG: oligopeptide/dipeptide transporter,ATP-binding protein C-terminal domain [Fibrobacteria bacterium]|jgi:oligopeptide/dipeptide ABC transporter ATP-binding protein|nr:oligopeptide/dipeptide transporter,ATP-binding protein C-terminal domain [Fibrobacteria bacterium]
MPSPSEPLLRVENLSLGFRQGGRVVPVTDAVSFEIGAGEVFGLVGESGCGKTVTCLGLLRLLPAASAVVLSGRAWYHGRDLLQMSAEEMRAVRGAEISMIFQEPSAALNPLLPVRAQLRLPFRHHAWPGDPDARIRDLLARVGFADPDRVLRSYPHELSGGMLQRVMIAHALLLEPRLILADEPTTALDVTIQAQILDLLADLQRETGVGILLITHNLNLVAQYADRAAVMYAGRVVEQGPAGALLNDPRHPYARGLLDALPNLETARVPLPIPGSVPAPDKYPAGCRFHDRCPRVFEPCTRDPAWTHVEPGHGVACHLYESTESVGVRFNRAPTTGTP